MDVVVADGPGPSVPPEPLQLTEGVVLRTDEQERLSQIILNLFDEYQAVTEMFGGEGRLQTAEGVQELTEAILSTVPMSTSEQCHPEMVLAIEDVPFRLSSSFLHFSAAVEVHP